MTLTRGVPVVVSSPVTPTPWPQFPSLPLDGSVIPPMPH